VNIDEEYKVTDLDFADDVAVSQHITCRHQSLLFESSYDHTQCVDVAVSQHVTCRHRSVFAV